MRILKANTAVRLVVGPLCDKTTGLAKTGMTVTNMAMNMWHEHDDGSAPTKSIDAVSFTASGGNNDMVELAGGYYDIEITAAQTNITAGRCGFCIYDDDVILPYFEEWLIVPANVFDSIMGTDYLDVNATQLGGTSQTGNDVGADVNDILADTGTDGVLVSSGTGAKQISLDAGKVLLQATQTGVTIPTVTDLTNLPTMPADWVTASGLKTDAVAEIADGVLDEAMAGHVGAGTLGKAIADTLEDTGTSIPADLVDIENKIDVIATDTTTEIPASITALDGKIDTIDNYIDTEVAAIKAKTDNLPASPAAVGSAMTLTAAYDKAKDDVLTPLATVDGIVDAIKAKTDNLPSDPADQSLLEAAIAAVSGGGTGDTSWTYTLSETDLTPIADATVWVTSDEAGASILAYGKTDASGQVTFLLNSGATVYVWAKKFGWTFTNPDSEIVS